MKKKQYTLPLVLIFALFFLWAISSNLLPTMIRQIMKTCELNTFQASFTETSYWLAYFIFPIPVAMFLKRYSYKAGIIAGLLIAAGGALLFFAAVQVRSYWAYLCVFFIIATGMCFLETSANPYVTVLGEPEGSVRRLNLAQAFNGLGAFISAMFLSKLVLTGNSYTRETLPDNYPGGWEAFVTSESNAMAKPYLILATCLIVAALVFIFVKMPRIGDENSANGQKKAHEKLIDFTVLRHAHLRNGVIAQFFYNGGQTAMNSLFLVYCTKYAGIDEGTSTTFFGFYMLSFLLGRWVGTLLMVRIKPQHMLVVYSLTLMTLCGVIMAYGGLVGIYCMIAVSFFMSIIYPTQFSLSLRGLGEQTKSGSAFLVMGVVGNACLPQLTALVMHCNEEIYQIAYIVPLVCFSVCLWYGWKGFKCKNEIATNYI